MWHILRPPTVPQREYDAVVAERNALRDEVKRLQAQVNSLTSQHEALSFDEALARGLAHKAVTLLAKIQGLGDNRKVTVALRKEMDTLLGEARSAGLMEEEEKSDATSST